MEIQGTMVMENETMLSNSNPELGSKITASNKYLLESK
jgi:hypothetical protein